MKDKDLLNRLYKVQAHKSTVKKIAYQLMDALQKQIDILHEQETETMLIIQELQKKRKTK